MVQLVLDSESAGAFNTDSENAPELGVGLPWPKIAPASWLDYQCWIEAHLDAGMALHKPLPQATQRGSPGVSQRATLEARGVDTLASGFITDPDLDANKNGVNTRSGGDFEDVLQRMATSTYRFVLRGHGLRAAYQIPIPGLVSVAGVSATPAERQWAYNRIVGNLAGIPLWFAEWELWYYVALPPEKDQVPPPNLAEHIVGNVELPGSTGVQVPVTEPDTTFQVGQQAPLPPIQGRLGR